MPKRLSSYKLHNGNLNNNLHKSDIKSGLLMFMGSESTYNKQRNTFLLNYLSTFLARLQKLFFNYDKIADVFNLYSNSQKNRKIVDYKLALRNSFFKKKLYNIFKFKQKKIIIKKFCQFVDTTTALIDDYNTYKIVDSKSNLYLSLNMFFSDGFSFLKFYYFLKKLIKYLKFSLKFNLYANQLSSYKSAHLFNSYRTMSTYSSIDDKIKKLRDSLDRLDLKKKRRRLNTLLKIKEVKEKEEEEKEEQKSKDQGVVTKEGAVSDSKTSTFDFSKLSQSEILDAEQTYFPLDLARVRDQSFNNYFFLKNFKGKEDIAITDQRLANDILLYSLEKKDFFINNQEITDHFVRPVNLKFLKLLELRLRQNILNNEFLKEYARHINIEFFDNFLNDTYVNSDSDIISKFNISVNSIFNIDKITKKITYSLPEQVSVDLDTKIPFDEAYSDNNAQSDDEFEYYALLNERPKLNWFGENPSIHDNIPYFVYEYSSNKVVFSKIQQHFLLLPYRERESSKYFKFNSFFLDMGKTIFKKNKLLNGDFYENIVLNDYEFYDKFKTKFDVTESEDSSYDFSELESKNSDEYLHYSLFNDFKKKKIVKNDIRESFYYTNFKVNNFNKPIFSKRCLYVNNYKLFYNFVPGYIKLDFKKLFILKEINKKVKKFIKGRYFFKFYSYRKIFFKNKKNIYYSFFFNLLKKSSYIDYKQLLNYTIIKHKNKKFKNKINRFKLISEFS